MSRNCFVPFNPLPPEATTIKIRNEKRNLLIVHLKGFSNRGTHLKIVTHIFKNDALQIMKLRDFNHSF